MKILAVSILLLAGSCCALETKNANRTSAAVTESLDSFADLVLQKYSSNGPTMDLSEFSALWANLLRLGNNQSVIRAGEMESHGVCNTFFLLKIPNK